MLIPYKDDNPSYRTPYVTYGILALNVAVFLVELLISLGGGAHAQNAFFYRFGLVPADVFHGQGIVASIIPFFTSLFLHGGIMHIGFNMLYLWIFSDNIESELGHGKFLVFYLLCGVLASLTQVLVDFNSTVPIIGASGAISGVLGAYYIRFPYARVKSILLLFIIIPAIWIPAKFLLGFWFVMQLISGLGSIGYGGGQGGVAFFAHIGGFVFGIVLYQIFENIRIEIRG